jgi:membrane protein YqaA with SNARE-associated domain
MRTADRLLVLSLVLLAVYFVVTLMVPGVASISIVAYDFMLSVGTAFGYLGAFFVSLVGNATVLVPFPYIGILFILGGLTDEVTSAFLFDPLLAGIVGGIGATIGEMTGFILGYGGGKVIDEEQRDGFRRFAENHPRLIPLVIWFLAATPIPDDVLIVPLGASCYSWWKIVIPELIGKTMFLTAIAWAGRFGLEFVGVLIGSTDPTSITSRAIEVVALALVIIAVYALVKIDWNKLTER